MKRVIPVAVHAEREDTLVPGEYGVGAIPLVHIEIDNRDPPHTASALKCAYGDGHVVEHAEPLAVIGKGVMRTAGEVHRDAIVQGGRGRFAGAADGAERSLDERRRPGEADSAHVALRERPAGKCVHVVGRMSEQECLA